MSPCATLSSVLHKPSAMSSHPFGKLNNLASLKICFEIRCGRKEREKESTNLKVPVSPSTSVWECQGQQFTEVSPIALNFIWFALPISHYPCPHT